MAPRSGANRPTEGAMEGKDYEERARTIFGERAAYYTTSKAHADRAILGRMVEIARPQSAWRVLDVGTGTGHTALAFAPHVREVVGLDLTEEMLKEARKLAAENEVSNLLLQEGDAHDMSFEDEAFDLVTCRRAAHHFSDIGRALGEMIRVLKRGGMLLIDDRSVPEDDWVDETMHRLDCLHDESHVRQYRPSCWRIMLEDLGCRVTHTEPYTKHRPVTSLTTNVRAESVAEIRTIFDSLTEGQRRTLGVVAEDDGLYSTHWYVTVAARRAK